jgi:hypothetical protein
MYWGDYWNVPPTTDPCDCCSNYVGPSHSPHGSTPCYYGPAAPYGGHPVANSAPVEQQEVVVAGKPAGKTTTAKTSPPKSVTGPTTGGLRR